MTEEINAKDSTHKLKYRQKKRNPPYGFRLLFLSNT